MPLFHGEPGEIEFVINGFVGDSILDWHMETNGPGVMILEPKVFGSVSIRDIENAEDLEFVSRGTK